MNFNYQTAIDALQKVPEDFMRNLPSVFVYAGLNFLGQMTDDLVRNFIGEPYSRHLAVGIRDTMKAEYAQELIIHSHSKTATS